MCCIEVFKCPVCTSQPTSPGNDYELQRTPICTQLHIFFIEVFFNFFCINKLYESSKLRANDTIFVCIFCTH